MKIKLLVPLVAVVICLGGTHRLTGQGYGSLVDQAGPSDVVGWNTPASLCQLLPGSAKSVIDYATGAVSFPPNTSGTIGLICSMLGMANGFDLPDHALNYVDLTFSNPNVAAGCTVSVFMVDRTTGASDGWTSDKSTNLDGVWTAHAPLIKTFPIAANHTHDVDVYLTRPASAGNTCNPVAFGMFVEGRPIYF